jgi:hypothetical protein
MNTYTVTLTAAQGGRHPHTFRAIQAENPQEAIVAAYRERHGDHVTSTTRDVHPRGMDITDRYFTIYGTAGAVTFADVEKWEHECPCGTPVPNVDDFCGSACRIYTLSEI